MRQPVTRTVIGLSGLMALAIGGSILFDPHTFFAHNGVALGDDPNLLSEIRAPGGVLIAAGLIMIAGAAVRALLRSALVTGAVVFGVYGVSRLVSLGIDGAPSSSLMTAMAIELLVAAYAVFALSRASARRCAKTKETANAC
ncbi:MAG: DUF4345 domain-containing protein [Pseudomonadota bacterium]